MIFQLVIQARGNALDDYDLLLAFEEKLSSAIGALGEVDGHDAGSGETNIFIMTDDPKATFAKAVPVLQNFDLIGLVRAAYRDTGGTAYTMLWPPGAQQEFEVL